MKVGFTGTRRGMTKDQSDTVLQLLTTLKARAYNNHQNLVALHGDCIGSDADFNELAHSLFYATQVWPASDVHESNRAHCLAEVHMPAKPALIRNRDIVDNSEVMIACPKGYEEEWRGSGTWAAIRYAQKINKSLYLVYPNGTIEQNFKLYP